MSLFLLAALSIAPATSPAAGQPPIRVWLSTPRSDIYVHTGDPVRVLFRSGEDGYVLIMRINAEGHVQMLFPGDPGDTAPVPGGGTFEVLGRGQPESFVVDESDGSGYVLGAWSSRPFQLARFARKDANGGWDYSAINAAAERVSRDAPRSILTQIARAIAEDSSFEYDITAYTVANQPPVIAETVPPYEDERPQQPQQYQMPESAPQPTYPEVYPYQYVTEYYQPLPYYGRGHRHHRAFVPCEWQCYPGSPNTLVGGGPLGGSTGTGLIIGRGDPASYVAVPQRPKPHVVTAQMAAAARAPAPAARASVVPSRALVAAMPRPEDKIRFGPVAPIRSRALVESTPLRTPNQPTPAPVMASAAPAHTRAATVAAPAAGAVAVRVFPNRLPTVTQPQGYATVPRSAGAVAYTAASMLQPASPQASALRLAGPRPMGAPAAASTTSAGPGTHAFVGPARPVVVRAR